MIPIIDDPGITINFPNKNISTMLINFIYFIGNMII